MVQKSKLFRTKFHLRHVILHRRNPWICWKNFGCEGFLTLWRPSWYSLDQFYPSLHYKVSRFQVENQFEEFMIQNGAYRRRAVRIQK